MTHPIDGHLSLTEVSTTDQHIAALFKILCKRQENHRISHTRVPSLKAHRQFVLSHTYRHWFLVAFDNDFIGTVYLTNDNVIGIFLEDVHVSHLKCVISFVVQNFNPLPEVPSLRSAAFTINLAPNNTEYALAVEELGGRLIQKSYTLPSSSDKVSQ